MRFLWGSVLLSLLGAQTITTIEPTLTVCGDAGTFRVTVQNTTSNPLTGVQMAVSMPPGIQYEVGSVTAPATEISTNPANQPAFGLPNLAPGASVTFTFRAQARCAILEYVGNPNNEVKNTYQLTWNGGSYTYTPPAEYTILRAALDYLAIVNQDYNASMAPTTFTRTFTVRNDGNGRIAAFRHIETAEPNLEILGASGGTIISHTAHGLTLEFNATHFTSIGNGDIFFDPGEAITFQVQYRILGCTNLRSTFALTWGCNGETCQTIGETGSASVSSSGIPYLVSSFPPNNNPIVFTQESSCYQDAPSGASRALFRLTNAGAGTAYQVEITLFVSDYPSDVYRPDMPARIDTGSIVVRRGSIVIPRTILSAEAGQPTACFSVNNPVKRFTLRVPALASGETLYVEFDHYVCGIEACHYLTRSNLRSIGYSVIYRNSCNQSYTLTGGSNYRAQFDADLSISAPDNVDNGQTFSICARVQGEPGSYTFWFADNYVSTGGSPSALNYRFEWVFQLPPGLVYTGGPVQWVGTQYNDANVTLYWPATSVNVSGNIVRVIFTHTNRPEGWQTAWPSGSFNNSYVCLPVQVQCGNSGTYAITAQLLFNPNPDCNPNGICYGRPRSHTVSINCPEPCPDGIEFVKFRFERISLGLRDDDNDGVPDGNIPPDPNRILLKRLMVTDTALAYMEGVVRATNVPFWEHAWALLHLGNYGDVLRFLDVRIQIRRGATVYAGNLTFTQTSFPAGWPHDNRMGVNLSTSSLASQGIVPPSFVWQEGDTIRLYIRLRLEYNTGGPIHPVDITPYFYTTTDPTPVNPIIEPHPASLRYSCRRQSASAEIVGYYFYTDYSSSYNSAGCDTLTLTLHHYLSIGPCCSNYCSGNLFPYEYRLWAIPDTLYAFLPAGWQYVPNSAYLIHDRTRGNAAGTAASCTHQMRAPGLVEPIDPTASPLAFPLRGAFTIHGGNLIASDDGMWGMLVMKVLPSCRSEMENWVPVDYRVRFTGRLNETHTPNPKPKLYYRGPRLRVEALANPTVARQRILEWRLKVSNTSNVADAPHSFLFFQSYHGHLSLIEVRDAATMNTINPTNGYYPIGTIARGSDRYFIVRAELRSCGLPDTIMAKVGWGCTGYPTSLLQYPCLNSAPHDTLTYILGTPELVLGSTITPNPSELCDTLDVTITISNGGTAYAYNPMLYMILPSGTQYVAGSAQVNHAGAGWTSAPDPTVLFGFLRAWNLTQLVPAWAGGMPDTLPGGEVQIRFRMTTTCNYINGTQVRFYGAIRDLCNHPQYRISASPIIALTNVVVPYVADIQRHDIEVRGCDREYTYLVEIINRGAGSTTSNDSVRVTIPGGVYVQNSTVPLRNFASQEPQISSSAAGTVLSWGLSAGVPPQDTIRFRFRFRIDPSVPSGTYPLTIQSVINATRYCGPTTCNIFYPTGTQNATMTIIRPTGLWTGEIDRDWFKPYNWGNCQVPDCAVDVIIPDTINEPLILGGTASCRDITIQSNSSLEIGSTGALNICRDYILESNAQLTAQSGSIIRFVGSTDQRYVRKGIGDPWNVEISQAVVGRRVILLDELRVQGTLTLNTGVIDGFSYDKETFTTRPSASALNEGNLNSYISGVLRRNINTTSVDGWYHLPVGHLPSGKGYELAQVRFNSTPTVSQLVSYFVPNVATNTIIQTDCGANYGMLPNLNHGYWVIRRTDGTPTPYHLRVYSRGYTNAVGHPEGYAIVKRPDGFGGSMGFEGVCEGSPFNRADQTGRRNLNDFSEFAVAQSPVPLSVQFIRVHAVPQSTAILLTFQVRQNWSQLLHHEIERSEDGIHWQKVAELPRESYSHREGDIGLYRWQDSQVRRSQSYFYRIRAVEMTGNTFLSPVVEATLPPVGQLWAQIVPNPSHEEAWLETSEAGHPVRIWDAAGKLVWEGISAERIPLPSDRIGAGVYIVEVGGVYLRWVKQ